MGGEKEKRRTQELFEKVKEKVNKEKERGR